MFKLCKKKKVVGNPGDYKLIYKIKSFGNFNNIVIIEYKFNNL